MTSRSLTSVAEFRIDLADKVADATNIQLHVKKLQRLRCAADILATDGLDSGDIQKFDADGVQQEEDGISTALGPVQGQLDLVLNNLSAYPEVFRSELEGFYAPADSRMLYVEAEKLVAWTEETRKHLIEIPGKTQVLLREKEERRVKKEEGLLSLHLLSDEMKTLKMRVLRTEKALNASKQLEGYDFSKPSLKPIALPPSGAGSGPPSSESELMQVDDDRSGSCSEPFADLEQFSATLRAFRDFRSSDVNSTSILQKQITTNLQAASSHPNPPNSHPQLIDLDSPDIQNAIRQIVTEEFQTLSTSFLHSHLSECLESGNQSIYTHISETMVDTNKLVRKLMIPANSASTMPGLVSEEGGYDRESLFMNGSNCVGSP